MSVATVVLVAVFSRCGGGTVAALHKLFPLGATCRVSRARCLSAFCVAGVGVVDMAANCVVLAARFCYERVVTCAFGMRFAWQTWAMDGNATLLGALRGGL